MSIEQDDYNDKIYQEIKQQNSFVLSDLAILQKELLHQRIQFVLSNTTNSPIAKLMFDQITNGITDKIREDIHNKPKGFFDKILNKIYDYMYNFIGSKLLQFDRQQIQIYYTSFLKDARTIIQTVKDNTISDLAVLYRTVFESSLSGNGSPQSDITPQTTTDRVNMYPYQSPLTPQSSTIPPQYPNNNSVKVIPSQSTPSTPSPKLVSKKGGSENLDCFSHIIDKNIETSSALFNPGLKNKVDKAQGWVKNGEIRYDHLHQNLRALYVDMNKKFPGLCITSCNDGSHTHNSRHYDDLALDIGKGSSDPQAYNKFVSYLKTHEQELKEDYDVEDIIGLKGEKDHLHHIHIELPKSDKYSNHYTNQNVA